MATQTDDELVEASRHLFYEFRMLRATAVRLRNRLALGTRRSEDEQVLFNVLVEAFLIHARNLLVFLRWHKPHHPEEILAQHFVSGWTPQVPQQAWLSDLHAAASSRIVHLSYARSSIDPELDTWPFREIGESLEAELLRLIRLVPTKKLDPVWQQPLGPMFSSLDPEWPRGVTGGLVR